jgi:hypothetical protein
MKRSSLARVTVTLLGITATGLYGQGQTQNRATGSVRSRADETSLPGRATLLNAIDPTPLGRTDLQPRPPAILTNVRAGLERETRKRSGNCGS